MNNTCIPLSSSKLCAPYHANTPTPHIDTRLFAQLFPSLLTGEPQPLAAASPAMNWTVSDFDARLQMLFVAESVACGGGSGATTDLEFSGDSMVLPRYTTTMMCAYIAASCPCSQSATINSTKTAKSATPPPDHPPPAQSFQPCASSCSAYLTDTSKNSSFYSHCTNKTAHAFNLLGTRCSNVTASSSLCYMANMDATTTLHKNASMSQHVSSSPSSTHVYVSPEGLTKSDDSESTLAALKVFWIALACVLGLFILTIVVFSMINAFSKTAAKFQCGKTTSTVADKTRPTPEGGRHVEEGLFLQELETALSMGALVPRTPIAARRGKEKNRLVVVIPK